MSIWIYSIKGYSRLNKSLIKFCHLKNSESQEQVYLLNTANLDSFRLLNPNITVSELDEISFIKKLNKSTQMPYNTEIQLYKSMTALSQNILFEALTEEQKEAYAKLIKLMINVEFWFNKTYGEDIDSKNTTYKDCEYGLESGMFEPQLCFKNFASPA